MTDDELVEVAEGCWPATWTGQSSVELDNVGDPGEWLSQRVTRACLDVLTQGEITDDEPLAGDLVEDYLIALEEHGFSPPWAFGDDPTDPAWIAECVEAARREFVAFLRAWRQNMKSNSSLSGNA